jgi:lysophospholipid acyltransferase (LPLAT)-like uncharacterized protein
MISLPDPRTLPLRGLYALLRATVPLRLAGATDFLEEAAGGAPCIFACRHGQLLPLLWSMEPCGLTVVVSRSRDGELLARLLRPYGFALVRGSSSAGGRVAAREALRVLGRGGRLGMAVDGPRGPRGTVQEGLLRLAQQAGVPVVPLKAHAPHALVLRGTWDHFELPCPGRSVQVEVGRPLTIAPGAAARTRAGIQLAAWLEGSWDGPRPEAVPTYGHP